MQPRSCQSSPSYATVVALCFIIMCTGCGERGPEVVPVSGTLVRNGEPVPNLFITFKPDEGRPSWGKADENGHFTLEYGKNQPGARVGNHTVWVVDKPSSPKEELDRQLGLVKPPEELREILKKYGSEENTPLKEIKIEAPVDDLVIALD